MACTIRSDIQLIFGHRRLEVLLVTLVLLLLGLIRVLLSIGHNGVAHLLLHPLERLAVIGRRISVCYSFNGNLSCCVI